MADVNSLIIASSKNVEELVSVCLLICDGETFFAVSADNTLGFAVVGLSAIEGLASCGTEGDDCTPETCIEVCEMKDAFSAKRFPLISTKTPRPVRRSVSC